MRLSVFRLVRQARLRARRGGIAFYVYTRHNDTPSLSVRVLHNKYHTSSSQRQSRRHNTLTHSLALAHSFAHAQKHTHTYTLLYQMQLSAKQRRRRQQRSAITQAARCTHSHSHTDFMKCKLVRAHSLTRTPICRDICVVFVCMCVSPHFALGAGAVHNSQGMLIYVHNHVFGRLLKVIFFSRLLRGHTLIQCPTQGRHDKNCTRQVYILTK